MIYRNKTKRSVVCPGIFGARICKNKSKAVDDALRNGDSLLINLKRSIFAVADSPEWNPTASKEFLVKFNQRIEHLFTEDPETRNHKHDIEILKNVLIKNTNQLIEKVGYLSSTTFTCLFVIPDMHGLKGLVFHCGDSCIFKVDLCRKHISQISWTNMNFVGRSNKLSQVKLTKIDEDTRFVMCTDGLQALSRHESHVNLKKILLDSFGQTDVDQIPDLLIDYYGRDIEFPDDIAIIILDPNKLSGGGNTIICGG